MKVGHKPVFPLLLFMILCVTSCMDLEVTNLSEPDQGGLPQEQQKPIGYFTLLSQMGVSRASEATRLHLTGHRLVTWTDYRDLATGT